MRTIRQPWSLVEKICTDEAGQEPHAQDLQLVLDGVAKGRLISEQIRNGTDGPLAVLHIGEDSSFDIGLANWHGTEVTVQVSGVNLGLASLARRTALTIRQTVGSLQLPFEDHAFDVALYTNSKRPWWHERRLVSELSRVVKADGVCGVVDRALFRKLLRRRFERCRTPGGESTDHYLYLVKKVSD